MDVDMMRDGEHFSTFDPVNFLDEYPDEMTHLEGFQNLTPNEFEWGLDSEREINGDIALIPMCDMSLTKFSDSPPNVDDFHKIVNDWQQFINVDPHQELNIGAPIIPHESEPLDPNLTNFDITSYLNDVDSDPQSLSNKESKKFKAGVKKIDLEAQKYIIDEEDDVDVETISESEESSPVLEAGDLKSLLEQFEATQIPKLPVNFIENEHFLIPESKNKNNSLNSNENILAKPVKIKIEEIDIEENELIEKEQEKQILDDYEYGLGRRKECKDKRKRKIDKIESTAVPPQAIKKEDKVPVSTKTKLLIKTATPNISASSPAQTLPPTPSQIQNSNLVSTSNKPQTPKVSPSESATSLTPNKQILDSLPQELINRIKESGKRKSISVIPPIPAKKRGGPKMHEALQSNKKVAKLESSPQLDLEKVQLDHNYCSSPSSNNSRFNQDSGPTENTSSTIVETYPKVPNKDSGFQSADEDERTVIGKQPTVKNADGKLMVSLLKVNTIHTPITNQQKKKLNLEEYKKRREGFLMSQSNSQNSSPVSSTCSSPLPEDENTKLLKHQEKLMRMAKEVLNTPPKADKKTEQPLVVPPPVTLQVPPDMEKKTLVSIGVNTDFKVRRNNLDPLAPVECLDEIKPLLQKASAKINESSLITSVIQTIPKIIDSCDPQQSKLTNKNSNQDKKEHGEDKTIVYLPKNRVPAKTTTVEVQTNISLIQQTKASRYRRRRQSSDSSTSSESSKDSRNSRSSIRSRYNRDRSSAGSRCSSRSSKSSHSSNSTRSSSSYSSRSSSRSRSRSKSPRYSRKSKEIQEKERMREVEERRVIYVGRIPPGTNRDELKKRFLRFGAITNVSIHSRDHSYLDNYGFVTFANKLDAYEALEHGNDDPFHPKFDLSFGGRRIFCQTSYSDLDNMRDECGYYGSKNGKDESFDKLLRDMQEKLLKRKA